MKRLLTYISLTLVFSILLSQTIPPQQEKEPVVKLPVSKWVIVLKGCSKLSIEEAQGVYMEIVGQINSQMQDTLTTKKK